MKFYTPNYGNASHDARPQFEMRGNAIYITAHHPGFTPKGAVLPWYENRGGKVYATEHHPEGKSLHPVYEIRGDRVHTTVEHSQHDPLRHSFELRLH